MRELTPKAEAMLARLPGNLREAVMLMAAVLRRKGTENADKVLERLENVPNGALVSVATNQRETRE